MGFHFTQHLARLETKSSGEGGMERVLDVGGSTGERSGALDPSAWCAHCEAPLPAPGAGVSLRIRHGWCPSSPSRDEPQGHDVRLTAV